MIYGYARVSTKGQERDGNGLAVQTQTLIEHGAKKIYSDAYTGTKLHRPELDKLLSILEAGDTVIVAKLDRIARSVKDGIEIIDEIIKRGANIDILNMGRFDNSPSGKLMRTMFLAFAEFERDMIVERTQAGKEIARTREDYHEGRPRITAKVNYVKDLTMNGCSVSAACRIAGISRGTYYNTVRAI